VSSLSSQLAEATARGASDQHRNQVAQVTKEVPPHTDSISIVFYLFFCFTFIPVSPIRGEKLNVRGA